MKKSRTYANTAVRAALILSALTFLGACRKDDTRKGPAPSTISPNAPTPGSPTAPNGPAAPRADGTSDPGGGTGVRGRVFESYIVDPKNLRGFNQHLKPIFVNLDRQEEARAKAAGEKLDGSTEQDFFSVKKWYLLPVTLNCVDKDVIGLSFATSNIDVLACQTRSEVWIDETKTKASSDREFAKLIMHEYIIGLYTLRFEKFSDILKLMEKSGGKVDLKDITMEQMDTLYPPEPARKLNAQDYEIIRAATDWAFEKGATATTEQFDRNVIKLVMDKRFHDSASNDKPSSEPEPRIEVSGEDFMNMLNANHSAGYKVEECQSMNGRKVADCSLTWNVTPLGLWGLNSLNMNFESEGTTRSFDMMLYSTYQMSATTEGNRRYYQFSGMGSLVGKKVGDRLSMTTFYFDANPGANVFSTSNVRFAYVAVVQLVITRISKKPVPAATETAQPHTELCYDVLASNHRDPWLNSFVARTKDSGTAGFLLNSVIERYFQREPICMREDFIVKPAPQQ